MYNTKVCADANCTPSIIIAIDPEKGLSEISCLLSSIKQNSPSAQVYAFQRANKNVRESIWHDLKDHGTKLADEITSNINHTVWNLTKALFGGDEKLELT